VWRSRTTDGFRCAHFPCVITTIMGGREIGFFYFAKYKVTAKVILILFTEQIAPARF
jgi:hypothetical protein